jgi:hypothetical protein
MKNKISKKFEMLKKDELVLLEFLKAKFPVFHNSNLFFRDFQYGIRSFFEKKDIFISYQDAETLANEMAKHFEENGIFIKVNHQGWKIHFPDFATAEPGDPF